jgi:glycosyltransferase involved in cell wall biosynthesis
MIHKPLVTIGVPTYNRPDGLKKAIEAILSQTYQNLEIIISDNCSSDSRVQTIAEGFSDKDSRIKYIRQNVNIGGIGNYNFLVQQANGEYFLWVADDDQLMDDYIETCMQIFEKNPNAVLAATCSKLINLDNMTSQIISNLIEVKHSDLYNKIKNLLIYFKSVKALTIFYSVYKSKYLRKERIEKYDSSDQGFILRMAQYGDFAINNDKTGYIYQLKSSENASGTFENIKKFLGLKPGLKFHFLITGRYIGISKDIFSIKKILMVDRIRLLFFYKNLFFGNPVNKAMVKHELITFNIKHYIRGIIKPYYNLYKK